MRSCTYTYYPGCALHSSAKEYDISTRLVREESGIKLREIDGWNYCGASSAHSTSHLLSVDLPARELQTTEQMRLPLMTGSAMYFSRLKYAVYELADRANLDLVKKLLSKDDFELPVLYFTQLLGHVLGFSSKQLLLNKHFTNPLPILRERGLA